MGTGGDDVREHYLAGISVSKMLPAVFATSCTSTPLYYSYTVVQLVQRYVFVMLAQSHSRLAFIHLINYFKTFWQIHRTQNTLVVPLGLGSGEWVVC